MVTRLDHIISVIHRDELESLSERLCSAGFEEGDAGTHLGKGTANVNLRFAGGAFLELCYEESPGSSGLDWWQQAPLLSGIVMNSSDYEADAQLWTGKPGAWEQNMEKELTSGERVKLHASGPFPREGFDPILMDRPDPPFVGRNADARLLHFTVRGATCELWRARISEYFGLEGTSDQLRLGDAAIRFKHGDEDPVELSATFAVPREKGVIPLVRGSIELV